MFMAKLSPSFLYSLTPGCTDAVDAAEEVKTDVSMATGLPVLLSRPQPDRNMWCRRAGDGFLQLHPLHEHGLAEVFGVTSLRF